MVMRVSDLSIYPIKSCGRLVLNNYIVGERGIDGDRNFVVVAEDGFMVTQRNNGAEMLALVTPTLMPFKIGEPSHLRLVAPRRGDLFVRLYPAREPQRDTRVQIFKDEYLMPQVDDETSRWFSDYLGREVRVVNALYTTRIRDGQTLFAQDGAQLHLVSQTSIDFLREHLGELASPWRFRPNGILHGLDRPFDEDGLVGKTVTIGRHEFRVVKKTSRCGMVRVNPETGVADGQELTKFLTENRTDPVTRKIDFGVYLCSTGRRRDMIHNDDEFAVVG